MNSFRPRLALFLITSVLCFNACQRDPSTLCLPEIINNPNYFSTNQTLKNTCTKQQGIDYVLTGNTTYVVSADLYIEPGTIIELEDSASLVIETTGSLQALGTAEAPIVIRGRYNSTGHWRGIFVRSNSTLNQLQHVFLQDAGGASIEGETARGALVLLEDGNISISDSKIEKAASYGIHLASPTAMLSQLENSTLTSNVVPMRFYATQTANLSSTNNLQGNTSDFVEAVIRQFVNKDYYWPTIDVAYRLVREDSTSVDMQQLIGNASLTIAPGNMVEMSAGTGFSIRDLSSFTAVGTASAPIVFTGVVKGYSTWKGFEFRFTRQDNRFEHVRVEHGGMLPGVVYMWGDPKLTFRKVELTYSSSCAFYDAPKTANQAINSNVFRIDMIYTFILSQYCKGS